VTTEYPVDAIGEPIHRDTPSRLPNSHLSGRLRKLVDRRVSAALVPLAEGLRDAIAETRTEIEATAQRELAEAVAVTQAELTVLRREVETLRAELGRERVLAEITARLDRLEAQRGGLRAV